MKVGRSLTPTTPNGNLATRNGISWKYTYDYENRLTKVVHSGSTIQTNSYDGDGKRMTQAAGRLQRGQREPESASVLAVS